MPEMIRVSALTAMAELILSGCTTSSDHLYLYPNGARLDDTIESAARIGLRFHASRGSMSVGRSAGGLPPDSLVENEAAILRDTQRLIETYHDASRFSMRRIVVAPCSPFSVSRDLMRESRRPRPPARRLAPHPPRRKHQRRRLLPREIQPHPAEYAEELGWVGRDVRHAHCVQLDDPGIDLFARTGTGVAHCPCSNMRLASGIAPVCKMTKRGVPVGLGVDGCRLQRRRAPPRRSPPAPCCSQRVGFGPAAMTARDALTLATRGGAAVLNRDDIGALAPGMAADFIAFDLANPNFAGALHDPVAALVFCTPAQVSLKRNQRPHRRPQRPTHHARPPRHHRAPQPPRGDFAQRLNDPSSVSAPSARSIIRVR